MAPQLATLVSAAPEGDDWIHEIKYDGYRLLAWVDGDRVRLLTRNRKDWTDRFPSVVGALGALGLADSVLDGEVAVEVAGGVTSFQALQNVLVDSERGSLKFFVFDMLRVSSRDLRSTPLLERKARLEELLTGADGVLRFSDHVMGSGPAFLAGACDHGVEGIISKRASAPYRSGRGRDWLKVKCVRSQEFVIGGFTEPAGTRAGLGALHVGSWERGRLVYRGKVGTGFSDALLRDLRRRLERIVRPTTPFSDGPRGAAARAAHWVEPELVAQVRYADITDDGRLRHPSFEGLREDKASGEVVMEEAGDRTGGKSGRAAVRDSAAGKGSAKTSASGKPSGRRRSSGKGSPMDVGGVRLTSPGKVLYPEQGLTKLDLATYYQTVAGWMLPHISGRPLTLVRCPSGHDASCFFQKHMDESVPPAIRRVRVEERDGPEWYGVVDGVDGLVSLAQLGALELHTFNVREDQLERPDRFLIDLDPDEGVGWDRVVEAATHVRDLLAELGLTSFIKTTGGKGLHVVVPLVRRAEWDEVREFSKAVASLLVEAAPDRYTVEMSKAKRKGRVLLDYMRNTRGATAIEAYSTRARHGAPVAAPIRWEELGAGVRSDSFNVRNMPARLKRLKQDPWQDIGAVKQSITVPMRRSVGL